MSEETYKERKRTPIDLSKGGRTHQSFRDECDVNVVMKRWANGGVLEHINNRTPQYGDFSNATSYLDAMHAVQEAQEDFARLPLEVRRLCHHRPAELLALAATEAGREALAAAGLEGSDSPSVEPVGAEPPAEEPPPEPTPE